MERLTATLYRSCNVLVIVVLFLGVLPPAQNMSYPRFKPPIAHAREGAATRPAELLDESDPSANGPSGRLLATKMAEPEAVSPGDLIAYTFVLTNTTGAVVEPALSLNEASGGLLASKMAEPEAVSLGDLITYTVVLTNTTGAAMEGLVVSDPLPDGLAYVPGSAEGGEYDPRTRTLTWEVGELAAGGSLSLTFQARVRGDVLSDLVVNLAEVTGGGLAEPIQAQATVAVVSQALITPQGGVLASRSGRVRVDFPAGAVTQPVEATHRPLDMRPLPPGRTGLALRFELTAEVASDENTAPPIQFQEPVRLTVDLTGLVDVEALGEYQRPFVGYLDEATGRWVHLPLVEQVGPLLTVEVEHFSIFGAGADGEMELGWLPRFNDAQVSLFNGAFTYEYPIEILLGRGGLQPKLNLSYNSRRVDGILTWIQSDWVGLGWSIDTVEIVRKGVKRCWEDNWICYENKFVLVLNGTAYELKPATGNDYGRYHTEDESFLYIERRNAAGGNGSPQNTTSEYWIVRTKDGIEYRLGYKGDSEQVFGPYAEDDGQPAFGYVGTHDSLAAFRWRVDQVTDTHGNQLIYHYFEETKDEQCSAEADNCWGVLDGDSERASYLDRIEYNHLDDGTPGVRILFERDKRGDDVEDLTAPIAWGQWPGLPLAVFWQRYYLQGIQVQAWEETSNGYVTLREYRFSYDEREVPPDQYNNHIRRLRSITLRGRDGQELPATTFSYTVYENKGWCSDCSSEWEQEVFRYERLSQIDNGYGGVITATYQTPDSGYWHAKNYRVSQRGTKDRGILVSRVEYTYPEDKYDRCYEDDGACRDPASFEGDTGGELVGYKWVTETLKDGSGATVAIIEHDFWLRERTSPTFALGREIETRYKAPGGTTLRTVERNYVDDTAGRPSGVHFIYLAQTTETRSEGGGAVSTRVKYTYDDYGNLTERREYADADDQTPYRTYRWWYYPNEVDHIVDREASAAVYVGGGWELASATWYFYDGNDSPTEPPGSKGELTRVARLQVIDPGEVPGEEWPDCVHAYRTSEVEYGYDDYGNLITETLYADYGYMCQDSNWNVLPRGADKEPTGPRITQTVHDGILHTLPIQQTNAAGHVTYWYYYGVNGTSPVPADGFFGKLERVRDPNKAETRYRYDAFGRLTKVIRPGDSDDKPTVMYVYYDNNLEPVVPFMRATWRKRDPDASPWGGGTWSREFFDGLGRLIQVQTPHQDWGGSGVGHEIVRFITYNERGLMAAESVPYEKDAYVYDPNCNGTGRMCNPYVEPDLNQPQTHYSYDALGRVVVVTAPDGTQTHHYYGLDTDTNLGIPTLTGLPVHATKDANGHAKHYVEDAFGRLVIVRDFNGTCYPGPGCSDPYTFYAAAYYTYDVLDNLTDVWDADDNHTQMEYDQLGRKTQMDDPDMGSWSYGYDAAGNLVRQTDARNQTICFYYDALSRLKGKTYRTDTNCPSDPGYGGYAVKYYYDQFGHGRGIGRRTSMVDSSGSTSWDYDDRGRVTEETKVIDGTGGGTFKTQWSYYADDQVWTMTYPGGDGGQAGEAVTYEYNAAGWLKSVVGSDTYVQSTDYDAPGRVELRVLGNEVLQTDYVYYPWDEVNGRGRLQQLKTGTSSNPTSLQDLRYTYDAVGNVLSIEDWKAGSPQTQSFSYDALDRVVMAQASGGSGGTYGPENYTYNAIGNLTSKGGVSYGYNDPAHKHAVTHLEGVQKYWYDANGNQTKRVIGGDTYELTYDAENRLTQVKKNGSVVASFVYDGDGNRVKATVNGVTTVYIGDYYEQTGSTVRKYYYAGGRRVAMRENGTLNWLLTDHLGSTAITAYSGGGKKAEIRYKAWGEDRYTSGTTPTTYRFTGQRLEESLGLYYYRARWYDPALGRFVQPDTIVPDPANPQDLNRYAYVRNNPLLYTDPTGRYGETPLDVLFLVYDIAMLIVDVGDIIVSGPSPEAQRHLAIDVAATALDVACLLLPGATGGGPAARAVVGGATEAVRTGEMAKRLGQMGIKAWQLGQDIMYFAKRADGDLPGAQRSSQGSEFTERSFRRNLQRAKGPPPKWMQEPEAHHMLPRSLEDLFKQIDPSINIHDPRWGGWVERYEHRRWSRTYQLDWEAWLRANPEATLHDLIQKAAEMAHKYGINWAWQP